MKADDGEYYGFQKDMDVNEAVDCTRTETQEDTYDQYIVAELQLPYKSVLKQMTRVRRIFCDADGNPEAIGNYRTWADRTEYEIEFYDG